MNGVLYMPVEVGIWKIDEKIKKLNYSVIESEKKLENILERDLSLISDDYLLLGRQIPTSYGKFIDMLSVDIDGNIQIIELKKSKTSREVVAQALDYAYWVQNLSYSEILNIFAEKNNGSELENEFYSKFGTNLPEKINQSHNIIIVATELDTETERIVDYLSENYNVPINVVFFRYFKDNQNEYIVRSWLIDPNEVEEKASRNRSQSKAENWNGRDFVVTLGENEARTWEDCLKYNFISAGGGKWYSRTLFKLFVGARIFCMIPGIGYVGVGIVTEEAKPVRDFKVDIDGEEKSILSLPLKATNMGRNMDDDDLCEYLVSVKWLKTVPRERAYWEKGLAANQNSAFKLRSSYTLEKLTKYFELEE